MRRTLGLVQQSVVSSGGGFVYEQGLYERISHAAELAEFEVRLLENPPTLGRGLRASRGGRSSEGFLREGLRKIADFSAHPQGGKPSWDRWVQEQGVDLVYFSSPNLLALEQTTVPFISTMWDLGHRDLPEFPEFRGRTWEKRESLYKVALPRSFHVFTDSQVTGLSIEKHYGVRSDRWSPLGLTFPLGGQDGFIPTHEIPGGVYFLYPAKRWAHKNHLVLIDAMAIVREKLPGARLVFTGNSDGGGADGVSRRIAELGLGESVVDYGFVDAALVDLLMRNATALVMPSYLGPTNIPPLHALAVGTPAIVSNAHCFDSVIQDRLVVVEADQPVLWANEMLKSVHQKRQIPLLPDSAGQEEILGAVFQKFLERSRRWG